MATEAAVALARLTLGVSAAIAVVLLMRPLARRLSGSRAVYALWSLVPCVVAALLLPQPAPALRVEVGMLRTLAAASPPIDATGAVSTAVICALLAVHAAGVIAAIAAIALRQLRFVRRLGPLTRLDGDIWRSACAQTGPCLVGIWRPRIVVPEDFETRYRAAERALILAHERAHRRQGDPFYNLALAALIFLQWFNPLVHLAAARYRRDQELACDAQVMRRFPGARRRYAEAMLKTQRPDLILPLGCTWQYRHPLQERIAMLHHALPGRLRRRFGSGAVALLVLAAAGTAWALQSPGTGPAYARLDAPQYPALADGTIPQGTVYLKVRVGVDGRPLRIEPQRIVPADLPGAVGAALIDSATAAVRGWVFDPAQRDGRAVEGDAIVPIRFSTSAAAPLPAAQDAAGALDEIVVRRP